MVRAPAETRDHTEQIMIFDEYRSLTLVDAVERAASLSPAEREVLYRALRDELRREYQLIGPHAARNIARLISRRRSAGGHHADQADQMEQDFERDTDNYRSGAALKWGLAILAGRYDEALVTAGAAGASSDTTVQCMLDRACDVRRPEISAEGAACIRREAESSAEQAAAYRARLLAYPPIGWGTSRGDYAARCAAWCARPADDRMRDPNPRDVQPE